MPSLFDATAGGEDNRVPGRSEEGGAAGLTVQNEVLSTGLARQPREEFCSSNADPGTLASIPPPPPRLPGQKSAR